MARIDALEEAADAAPLAGGVAALEEDHKPLTLGLDVRLQLQQLELQRHELLLVGLLFQLLVVGVAARGERPLVDGGRQLRVVDVEGRLPGALRLAVLAALSAHGPLIRSCAGVSVR